MSAMYGFHTATVSVSKMLLVHLVVLVVVLVQAPLCSGFVALAARASQVPCLASSSDSSGKEQQQQQQSSSSAADDILAQLAGGIDLNLRKEPYQGSKIDLLRQQAGTYDQPDIQAQLQALVKDHPVAMLTFTECPYCIKARSIFRDKQCEYKELNLDTVGGRASYAYRVELHALTGRTSLPAIWIGGQFVGGCNDGGAMGGGGLMAIHNDGRLDDLLQQAGVM